MILWDSTKASISREIMPEPVDEKEKARLEKLREELIAAIQKQDVKAVEAMVAKLSGNAADSYILHNANEAGELLMDSVMTLPDNERRRDIIAVLRHAGAKTGTEMIADKISPNPKRPATLLHFACAIPDIKLVRWCLNKKNNPTLDINAPDSRGGTAVDLVNYVLKSVQTAEGEDSSAYKQNVKILELLRAQGGKSMEELSIELSNNYPSIEALLEGEKANYLIVSTPDSKNFSTVPALPKMQAKGPPVKLMVLEGLPSKTVSEDEHHTLTTTIATGTLAKLLGENYVPGTVIGMRCSLSFTGHSQEQNILLRRLLQRKEVQAGSVIFSKSESSTHGKVDHNALPDYFTYEDSMAHRYNPVSYTSSGNDEVATDGKSQQHIGTILLAPRTMSIGAAYDNREAKTIELEGYSSQGATLLAPVLPLLTADWLTSPWAEAGAKSRDTIHGTSFSTPYAAAVHTAIVQRYGQWEKNPYGLTPEEVEWTLIVSADKQIVDGAKGNKVVFTPNNAGMAYDPRNRAGFGVINPLKADELAHKLYEYKQAQHISSVECNISVDLTPAELLFPNKTPDNTSYLYPIAVPQSVLLKNVALGLQFYELAPDAQKAEYDEKTRIVTLEFDGKSYPINLSGEGTGLSPAMNSVTLPKGSKVILRTELSLKSAHIDFNGLDPDPKTNALLPFIRKQQHDLKFGDHIVNSKPIDHKRKTFEDIAQETRKDNPKVVQDYTDTFAEYEKFRKRIMNDPAYYKKAHDYDMRLLDFFPEDKKEKLSKLPKLGEYHFEELKKVLTDADSNKCDALEAALKTAKLKLKETIHNTAKNYEYNPGIVRMTDEQLKTYEKRHEKDEDPAPTIFGKASKGDISAANVIFDELFDLDNKKADNKANKKDDKKSKEPDDDGPVIGPRKTGYIKNSNEHFAALVNPNEYSLPPTSGKDALALNLKNAALIPPKEKGAGVAT